MPPMSITLKQPALALAAATALVVVHAAPASAAITVFPGGYVYGDAANDNIVVSCSGGDLHASGVTAGDDCAALTSLYVNPGAGTDTVSLSTMTPADFPLLTVADTFLDDSEADTFTGSAQSDRVTGDSDDTVNTGAGDDRIDGAKTAVGGFGDDVITDVAEFASGGPGDDRIVQTAPLGGVDGGEGLDTWEIDFDLDTLAPPYASLAFDVTASSLTLSVPGTPTSQTIPISGLEHVEATIPRTLPTSWNAAAFPGTQHVRAFSGPQTLVGGAFADTLFGGAGDDALTGGGGSDAIHAGAGNDTVNARDGEVDTIACGDGSDTVVADAGDVVSGCEVVQLPAVVTPPPPAPVVPATSAVKGKKEVAKPAKAKFTFSSPTAGATFQCKVDKGRWKSCSSPYKVATKKLKLGSHTLRVRAVLAGVVDPTPSVRKFKVTA
jgi:Ca2+-binding RTX toxin-like protein